MRLPLLLLAPLLLGAAPAAAPSTRPAHDRDPWIFRCVLDGNARIIVISLGNEVWAAYDANRCRLAKVWKGKVEFTGPVYDTRHGPQPKSDGVMLLDRPARLAPVTAGATTRPTEEELDGYRGYRIHGDHATLNFDFDGVKIEETPSLKLVDEAQRTVTLRREIKVTSAGNQSGPIVLEVPTSAAVRSVRLVEGTVSATPSAAAVNAPSDLPYKADSNLVISLAKPGTVVIDTTLSTE
jgi:cytochrome c